MDRVKARWFVIVGILIGTVIAIIAAALLAIYTHGIGSGPILTQSFLPKVVAILIQGIVTIIVISLCFSELSFNKCEREKDTLKSILKTYGLDEKKITIPKFSVLCSEEQKEGLENVERNAMRLDAFMSSLSDTVLVIDEQCDTRYCNEGIKDLTGKYVNDVLRYNISEKSQFRDTLLHGTYNELTIRYKNEDHKAMMMPIVCNKKVKRVIIMLSKLHTDVTEINRQKRIDLSRKEKISSYVNELKRSMSLV